MKSINGLRTSKKGAASEHSRDGEAKGIKKPGIVTIDFADFAAANRAGAAAVPDRELFDQFELAIAKQFDADYYAYEYPDIISFSASLLGHYCRQGWYEGRNPNPFFDTVAYLDQNSDVELVGINPYFHYLMFGRKEGREIDPSVSPSVRTRLLFGRPITELVDRLRKHVDVAIYLSQLEMASAPTSIRLRISHIVDGGRESLQSTISIPQGG